MSIAMNKSLSKLDTITLIISIVALIVSFRSCSISREANRLSERALVLERKPLLSVDIRPSQSDTNTYYDVIQVGEELRMIFSFEVENKGGSPASNIQILPDSRIELTATEHPEITAVWGLGPFPHVLSIAPGEAYELTVHKPLQPLSHSDDYDLAITALTSDIVKIVSEVHFIYGSSDLADRMFRTRVRHEFTSTGKPYVLLTEFQDISDKSTQQQFQEIVSTGTNQIHEAFIMSITRDHSDISGNAE